MKANELMIGNLLKRTNGQILTVSRIDLTDDILVKEENGLFTFGYTVNPIKLTEEWLSKLGIKGNWSPGEDYCCIIEGCHLLLKHEQFRLGYKIIYDFKYVHQLQNIYFALTGEELTIKQ